MGGHWTDALPPRVVSALSPSQRRALDNPTRRRILRHLSNVPSPTTLPDLAIAVSGASISTVAYHVMILDECGCVLVTVLPADNADDANGDRPRSFAANLGTKRPVLIALEATEELDERQ